MRTLLCLAATMFAFTTVAFAGPEPVPSGKDMKEVAPHVPPTCDWSGFYTGANLGGQFGHSEDHEVGGIAYGYHEAGFSGSGLAGYNWQWHYLVFGPEIELGYMNLDGSGSRVDFEKGESSSDFFATFRGRVGVALDKWLIYGTGGGIALNYYVHVFDPQDRTIFDADHQDFNWGYTVGGGIERKINCRWSIKAEYLYFSLDRENLSGPVVFQGQNLGPDRIGGDTTGHMVRAGLNFHF